MHEHGSPTLLHATVVNSAYALAEFTLSHAMAR
jgi:hypothetical protein